MQNHPKRQVSKMPANFFKIPNEFYYRLHHPRPRFKNDIESVLLYMASEISHIQPCDDKKFSLSLNTAIRLYPGNGSVTEKTINNWRTEISALFGLVERKEKLRSPSKMAFLLSENQDLIEFFRYFLYYFQYPGGFLKPHEVLKMIDVGVKFKPAKYIIQVVLEGQKLISEGKFGITKAEATHCIFNDLRVTRDLQSPKIVALKILENRKNKVEYDNRGDVTRYAGDILDYMELADLTRRRPNYQYYLNMANYDVLQAFVSNDDYFKPYDSLYANESLNINDIKTTVDEWFNHINNRLYSSIFSANVLSVIKDSEITESNTAHSDFITEMLKKLRTRRAAEGGMKTKEIGDVGESIVLVHEKARLKNLNRFDVLHLIKKISEHYAVGYDIGSYEGVGTTRRYIEVKTTISRGKLHHMNFHMTTSEWSAADTLGGTYFIYRLAISSENVTLFVIKDPVGKYKQNLIEMIPCNGVDMRYTEKSGYWEELLV